jgi:aldehyde:ferredoxin oxidoreductase
MGYGWVGKILRIDLTTGKQYEEPTEKYSSGFLGGRGINAKIHWDNVPPSVGAFDPENVFSITTGPTTGTFAPQSGKSEAGGTAAQPYPRETYTRSGVGGRFGPYLKFSGYDGLIIQGRAAKPVWISIDDGTAKVNDAGDLWGMTTFETQKAIWSDFGVPSKVAIMAIGPSGERLSRIATVIHDSGSALGQGGFGGVWGSKNLKAVAVQGTGSVEVSDPEKLMRISEQMRNLLFRPNDRPPKIAQHGYHRINNLLEYGERGATWATKYSVKAEACFGCPIACRTNAAVQDAVIPGGEAQCEQLLWYARHDIAAHSEMTTTFWKAAKLADALAVNSLELSMMIDWLVNLLDAGVISEAETGLPFDRLGEYDFAEALVQKIAYREGFGDVLAEGLSRAADIIGKNASGYLRRYHRGFANQFDGRILPVFALKLAMESRLPNEHDFYFLVTRSHAEYANYGWIKAEELVAIAKDVWGEMGVKALDETDSGMYNDGHAYVTKWVQNYECVKKSMTLCDWYFGNYASWYGENHRGCTPNLEPELFTAVTGSDLMPDPEALLRIGERIYNVERAIMIREGRTRAQDTVSEYYYTEKAIGKVTRSDGHMEIARRALDRAKFEDLKSRYYEFRGWDAATGKPTYRTLTDLGLAEVADELRDNELIA